MPNGQIFFEKKRCTEEQNKNKKQNKDPSHCLQTDNIPAPKLIRRYQKFPKKKKKKKANTNDRKPAKNHVRGEDEISQVGKLSQKRKANEKKNPYNIHKKNHPTYTKFIPRI